MQPPSSPNELFRYHIERVTPADWVTFGILWKVWAALTIQLPAVPTLAVMWLGLSALFVGFCVLAFQMATHPCASWVPWARAIAIVGTMFTLYLILAYITFDAIPWLGDPVLDRLDTMLFGGHTPALWAEAHTTPFLLEFLSIVYACFIPYLYLSIFLSCIGRPDDERDEFILGFAITYAVSFLGYLFVPARGPVVQNASQFIAPLLGGPAHQLVVSSVAAAGGPHGAFPSLHVGASWFACLFDLRHNPLRGLIYLPIVLLIAIATVFLRYHYVVDILAGVAIATVATAAARRGLSAWHVLQRRPAPAGRA